MKKIDIGELHLEFDSGRLSMSVARNGTAPLALDMPDIRKLTGFLSSLHEGHANQRQTFRLSAAALMDLGVSLHANGRVLGATANDLSVTGISVQINDGEELDVPLLGEVDVVLDLGDETQSHTAIVRRKEARGYGLFFPQSIRGEHIEPPHNLVAMILELQKRSLARLMDRA